MNETEITTEEKLALLRKRSKTGFLNQMTKRVTAIKETAEKSVSEEEYQEIIASIFD